MPVVAYIDDHVFEWDPISAATKFICNSTVTFSIGVISVSKNTPEHNVKTDAYRNCRICGKHYNYHARF